MFNETRDYMMTEWREPIPEDYTRKEIFRHYQSLYGKCTSSVYIDTAGGDVYRIGWFFVKKDRYCDTGGTFLQGTWITLEGDGGYVRTRAN
jgi:hypothetical protein